MLGIKSKNIIKTWNNLRIGTRLMIGVTIILLLTLIVGLVGWITLESQSRSQILATQAINLVSTLHAARQDEKNYMLSGNASHIKETLEAIANIRINAEKLKAALPENKRKNITQLLIERDNYQNEFENYVALNKEKALSLNEMVAQGRKLKNTAVTLRDDQKKELQHLEQLSTFSSKQRLNKRIKADIANRIIKLMAEARQQEKNFLLRKELSYEAVTRSLVNQAVHHAQLLRERFQDKQNRQLAEKIINAANIYLKEFKDVVIAESKQNQQQAHMVNAARKIELLANDIRDQTQLQADTTKETAVIIILFTLTLALILGIAAAILLTNSIARPIQQLVVVINKLAQEDQSNVEVPLVANKDEIGQIARALSNFKEVILRRKAKTEAQLIQTEKMAALGDLVAGVAHEINTPIGIAVTGSTHLQDQIKQLEKNFDQGTLKKTEFRQFIDNAIPTATTIQKNLERASTLIKSFKQVAVDQSSQEVRQFKLIEYIEEVLVSLHPKLKQAAHQVRVKGNAQLIVETVPGAISQTITNLIINSLTHAYTADGPAGKIQIEVETNDKNVMIHYSDDGKGMDQDTMQHIYEPFFTTRRGSGGSGLGLSIIFNLVTQTLGGHIQCQSEIDKGTRFEISFPIKAKIKRILNHE